jgi:AcrR family transcriptional regulator
MASDTTAAGSASSEAGAPGRSTGRDALLAGALDLMAHEGVGDLSLRQIASRIGTSHRMLHYHFGSREGLLVAVVEELDRRNSEMLAQLTMPDDVPLRELAWSFWTHAADTAGVYGPLFFELASHAMLGKAHTEALAGQNVDLWLDTLTTLWIRAGMQPPAARVRARLNLAVSRGLLHDLLLTGDREAVDAAMADFADTSLASIPPD